MIQAKLVVKLLSNIIDVHLTIIFNNDFLFSDFKKFTPLKHFTLHYILLLTWQPPQHFFLLRKSFGWFTCEPREWWVAWDLAKAYFRAVKCT